MKLRFSNGNATILWLNPYLLSALGFGMIGLHLLLTWKFTSNTDQLLLNIIFWATIVLLIWQKRDRLNLQSDWFSTTIGGLLMGLVLCKSVSLFSSESEFIRFFPVIASIAIALLASGWKLNRYFREFVIVLVLMLPPGLLGRLLEWSIGSRIQMLIAQSAAFFMHYVGVNLIAQGTVIILPTGSVRVEYACAGIPIWILLMQLSSLLIIVLGPTFQEMCQIVFVATGLAWLMATIRVVIMASLVNRPEQFDYWHGMAGGQIFSTMAIVLFALFCQRLSSISKAFSIAAD